MSTEPTLTGSSGMACSPWFVHVWVYGHYSGGYEFQSQVEAERDANDRRTNLARGIKGLRYIVSQRLPSDIEKSLV